MGVSIQQLFAGFLASSESDVLGTDYNECTLVCRFAAYIRRLLPIIMLSADAISNISD